MLLRQIFDSHLAQYAYPVGCQLSGEALIIDPERDIDRYRELAAENGLRMTAVAEGGGIVTFIHAEDTFQFSLNGRIGDGRHGFHALVEVPAHPVRRTEVKLGMSGVSKR